MAMNFLSKKLMIDINPTIMCPNSLLHIIKSLNLLDLDNNIDHIILFLKLWDSKKENKMNNSVINKIRNFLKWVSKNNKNLWSKLPLKNNPKLKMILKLKLLLKIIKILLIKNKKNLIENTWELVSKNFQPKKA
jgi:hypothetical protein